MTDKQLSILSQEVGLRLKQGCMVDESLLRDLVSAVADLVIGAQESTEAYDALSRDLEALFAYGDVAESPEFCAGASWGAVSVRAAVVDKESESAHNSVLRDIAERHRELLEEMRDSPGITQQELARKLRKKKSNLAQILARLERYRLFIVIPAGKYRKYSISSLGELILGELEAKQATTAINRSTRYRQQMPYGMEMLELDAIVAHSEHREALIDVRGQGVTLTLPVLRSKGLTEITSGDYSAIGMGDTRQAAFLKNGGEMCVPTTFRKSRFASTS